MKDWELTLFGRLLEKHFPDVKPPYPAEFLDNGEQVGISIQINSPYSREETSERYHAMTSDAVCLISSCPIVLSICSTDATPGVAEERQVMAAAIEKVTHKLESIGFDEAAKEIRKSTKEISK